MAKLKYDEINFGPDRLRVIELADKMLGDYAAAGYTVTLRQLFYQFVSKELIANSPREYKRLGQIMSRGRLAGLIDWSHIVDRTRDVRAILSWNSPEEIVRSAASSYHLDRWRTQTFSPEVWIEKDALVGVFEPITEELDVPLFSCRGYTSQSELWVAAQRMIRSERAGKIPIVFHFGDHDPSGIDMTRDIKDRLKVFGASVSVIRVALNMDQIKKYRLPPNPAKLTDSRSRDYLQMYGTESWELDALEPSVLAGLVRDNIEGIIDWDAWREIENREDIERSVLTAIGSKFSEVAKMVGRG